MVPPVPPDPVPPDIVRAAYAELAPGGGSVWPEQHRWNIGVVKAAAMEHWCRCGPGRGGAAEVCGAAGVCGASQASAEANLAAP